MISRLVLVGVVGALGISVPTWPEVRECMGAVHSWTAYQLAAWDACARSEVDTITMVAMPRPLSARTESVAGGFSRSSGLPSPTFEPIIVDERECDLAYELNRKAEGLDVASGAASGDSGAVITDSRLSDRTRRDSSEMSWHDEFSPPPAADAPELKLMVELLRAAESADGHPLPSAAPIAERRGWAPIAPLPCVFSRSPSAGYAAANDQLRDSGSAAGQDGSTPQSVAMRIVADAMPGTGAELNCFAERFDQPGPELPVASTSLPLFDLIDPGTDPGVGLADELNRASDGLAVNLPAPLIDDRSPPQPSPRPRFPMPGVAPVVEVPPSVATPRVAQALRLTREAVHAWMNVLTGPAIVQVSVR